MKPNSIKTTDSGFCINYLIDYFTTKPYKFHFCNCLMSSDYEQTFSLQFMKGKKDCEIMLTVRNKDHKITKLAVTEDIWLSKDHEVDVIEYEGDGFDLSELSHINIKVKDVNDFSGDLTNKYIIMKFTDIFTINNINDIIYNSDFLKHVEFRLLCYKNKRVNVSSNIANNYLVTTLNNSFLIDNRLDAVAQYDFITYQL